MSVNTDLYRYITFSHLEHKSKIDKRFLVNKKLKHLPIIDSLFVLSRIDVFLSSKGTLDKHLQKQLIDGIFNSSEAEILQEMLDSEENSILFHHQQIYYCMGQLLLYGKDQFLGHLTDEFLPILGSALFVVNEVIEKLSSDTHLAKLEGLNGTLWQMGHFSLPTERDFATELSRIYVIFEELEQTKVFAQLFHKTTGIDLISFWTVVFAIYMKWTASVKKIIESGVIIGKEYFSYIRSLNALQVQQSLTLLSTNLDGMKQIHQKRIDAFKHESFNFEFLREKPLLEYQDGMYICLSIPYLILRGTRGVSEIIRETRKSSPEVGNSLGESLGYAYEQYVKFLLRETYREQRTLATRFIDQKCKSIELADAVIDYGDELIVLEVKAMAIQKRYRLGTTRKDIENGLRDFLTRKGAKQLDRNIKNIRSGQKNISGVNPRDIRRYYPVLVTCVDDLPLFNSLYDYYCDILKQYNFLQDADTAWLTIINIRELEAILSLVEQGYSFIELLREKGNSVENRRLTFTNFLHFKKPNVNVPVRHSYLQITYDKLFEKYRKDVS